MKRIAKDTDIQLHALDHAWRYFELHANQRLSMFNFFVAFSALALAGVGAIVQAGPKLAVPGIFVGLIIPVVSFVFWKLDGRTAHLVKLGEASIKHLENELYSSQAQIFHTEHDKSKVLRSGNFWTRMYSYRQAFASMFAIVAFFGFAAAGASGFSLLSKTPPTTTSNKIIGSSAVTANVAKRKTPPPAKTERPKPPVPPKDAPKKGVNTAS